MMEQNVSTTDGLIQEKAQKIQEYNNSTLPIHKHFTRQFSNGWLASFKSRNEFKCYRSYGEGADADVHAIRPELPIIRSILASYRECDIFNGDEYGLFYQLPPSSTIGPKRIAGKKKRKARATFFGCANASGSERLPHLAIGKAQKPRCFENRDLRVAGLVYRSSTKGWMKRNIFNEWLSSFDSYIGKTAGRRAILLIDNASCHGNVSTLPDLHNTKVLFLPKNTTSHIQSMDAGAIALSKGDTEEPNFGRLLIQ